MPVSIECPNCAARFKVGDHLAGKRVKCKKCAGAIHVPDEMDLSKAKELPVKGDLEQIAVPVHPMFPHVKVKRPIPIKADPVARAEAFVAADAFTPPPAYLAPAVSLPGQTVFRQHNFDDPGRGYQKPVRASTAAPEGFSPLLLLIYVCVEIGLGVYAVNQPHVVSSAVWTFVFSEIISFFAIVAPLAWLGIWGASKAMRFELASPAYIKSAAVAVAPALLGALIKALPENPVLIAIGIFAILPATFFILKLVFSLTFVESLVAFLLGGIGCIIGRVIQLLLIGAIMLGANLQKATPPVNPGDSPNNIASTDTPPPTQVDIPLNPAVDPVLSQLNTIQEQARAQLRGNWLADTSRERASDQLSAMRSQIEILRPQATTADRQAKLNDVSNVLDELQTKVAQLPSEDADPIIFQPITSASNTWQPNPGDTTAPVSYKRYRLEMPTDAKVDLATTEEAPEGLSWDIPPRGRINVTAFDRTDPRQERPWIKTHSFMKTRGTKLFTLDMVNIPIDISYGQLGKLPATRIASKPADNINRFQPDRFVKYVIADGQSWVVITCTAAPTDARTLASLENAAWSLRQARGDEPRIDPFTADALVARLREERAQVLVRRMGTAAEPALLARINDSDGLLRQKVLELLADCGTRKSLPALLELCGDRNTQYAELARTAVRKISPADMDLVTEGLLDLQSSNFQMRNQGVEKLASATPAPDDPRKPKISLALAALLRDNGASFGIKPETLGDAIAVWQTPNTVTTLLPLLDNKPEYYTRRKTAMIVLAHTKDKRAVFPICRWLIEDTEEATSALISMGPIAEDDVIKILDQKSVKARQAACNVLAEVGTQKSLRPLGYVVSDNKSPGDADAANAAIAQIRERLGTRAPVPPAGKTPAPPQRPQVNDPGLNGNIWIPPTTSPPRNAPR
jgi:predicted Zn finger-like uncharacterized protein